MSPINNLPVETKKKSLLSNLMLALVSTFLMLLVAEATVRIIATRDDNGQYYVFEVPLLPYQLPIEQTEATLDRYFTANTVYLAYDPLLGWSPAPYGRSRDGMSIANSVGIRSNAEYRLIPPDGVLRIALFGDSYTNSSEVTFEQSWGFRLENRLDEEGFNAEVLNFGASGYGMDQAYLRYLYQGASYQPDVVVFGFQAIDVFRNINIFRPIYMPRTGIPFSKPRFVLDDNGDLSLVNSPSVPPEEILEIFADFDKFELSRYETYYDERYQHYWYLDSKLLALFFTLLLDNRLDEEQGDKDMYQLEHEAAILSLAIIDAFAADVEANGSEFVIVTLPTKEDLFLLQDGKTLPYDDMLRYLDDRYTVIHTEHEFDPDTLETYLGGEYGGHYSPEGYDLVSKVVYEYIRQWAEDEEFPRN